MKAIPLKAATLALLGIASVAATSIAPPAVHAAAAMRDGQAPGFYRMHVGHFEVTALLDGTHPFPVDKLAVGAKPGEVEKLLGAQYLASPVEGMINAFLINTGDRLVLIDSGAGNLYGKEGGGLITALRAAGYDPRDIDDIYLTHLHEDHVGGLMLDGKPSFPNATVYLARREAEFWLNSANKPQVGELLWPFFDAAQKVVAPYIADGRFKTFDGTPELLPGLSVVACPGHTPGHSCYFLQDGKQAMLFWGDLVHVQPVQLPDPDVAMKYDWKAPLAVATRSHMFAEAARNGWWVAGAHISFPGIGHVSESRAGHFAWIPANYTLNR